MQAGPDAVYRHRRCPELELTQGLAVIRASVSAAAGAGCGPRSSRTHYSAADRASARIAMVQAVTSTAFLRVAWPTGCDRLCTNHHRPRGASWRVGGRTRRKDVGGLRLNWLRRPAGNVHLLDLGRGSSARFQGPRRSNQVEGPGCDRCVLPAEGNAATGREHLYVGRTTARGTRRRSRPPPGLPADYGVALIVARTLCRWCDDPLRSVGLLTLLSEPERGHTQLAYLRYR